jgi:hypothetical protein
MSLSSSCSPCLYIVPKVCQQRIVCGESIGLLSASDVPMVALAGFIVITKHAHTIDDESKTILEFVVRAGNLNRHAPHDDHNKRPPIQHVTLVDERFGSHVVVNNNTRSRCQSIQHDGVDLRISGRQTCGAVRRRSDLGGTNSAVSRRAKTRDWTIISSDARVAELQAAAALMGQT